MTTSDLSNLLIETARCAVAEELDVDARPHPKILDLPLPEAHGLFVTIYDTGEHGNAQQLRGCIGTVQPIDEPLPRAIAYFARAAAFQDPRFPPIAVEEWPRMRIEISLLNAPTPVSDPSILEPKRDGVIVHATEDGHEKLGILLPDIDGVTSVDQQVQICRQKAGISQNAPIRLESFTVSKFAESLGPASKP